jgi:hypothetical protein
MGQPPKNPRSPVEPDSCRKALVNFMAAILLDYPLKENGRVFHETPAGESLLL